MSEGPVYDLDELNRELARHGLPAASQSELSWFGDSAEMARELGELVRAGVKAATTGLLWEYEAEAEPLPERGAREVVIDWSGRLLAVIEMTEVRVVAFDDVDERFARDEGEGDGSLEYWRRVHRDFFARVCAEIGRVPRPDMPVVCQRFKLLFPVAPER